MVTIAERMPVESYTSIQDFLMDYLDQYKEDDMLLIMKRMVDLMRHKNTSFEDYTFITR